jgi:hypothetical protein
MGMNQERDQLKRAYPSKRWGEEVDDMKDDQVTAIYTRLMRQGKLKK